MTKKKVELLPLEARVAQCINDFKPLPTTQDMVDQHASEYAVANLLRAHAEKRYDAAKRTVLDVYDVEVAKVRNEAAKHMMKAVGQAEGEDWLLMFNANKPATRVDVDELRTELIKCGVSVSTIDMAIEKVTKKSTPALIVTAVHKNGNRK